MIYPEKSTKSKRKPVGTGRANPSIPTGYTLILTAFCCKALVFSGVNAHGQTGEEYLPKVEIPKPATLQPNVTIGFPGTQPVYPVYVNPTYQQQLEAYERDRVEVERRQQQQQLIDDTYGPLSGYSYGSFSFPSHAGLKGTEAYEQALVELERMLSGKEPLSVKRAEFIKENAYYEMELQQKVRQKTKTVYATFFR
jgi:hypothetical protein